MRIEISLFFVIVLMLLTNGYNILQAFAEESAMFCFCFLFIHSFVLTRLINLGGQLSILDPASKWKHFQFLKCSKIMISY